MRLCLMENAKIKKNAFFMKNLNAILALIINIYVFMVKF